MKRLMLAAVALLAFSCGPVYASIQFFPGATDHRIASITDLNIGGVLYDATFEHNRSYNDFLLIHPDPQEFITNAGANLAAAAIRGAVNSASVDASSGTLTFRIRSSSKYRESLP